MWMSSSSCPSGDHVRRVGVLTLLESRGSSPADGQSRRPIGPTYADGLAGCEGLTRDRSSFGPRDVLQALSSAAGQGAPVSEIMAVAKSFLRGPSAVRLLGASSDVEARYSTPELLELERGVMDRAIALQGAGRGLAGADATERALLARPFLSGEQREMVRRLTQDGDGVAAVVGRAGTGKTTGLAAARDAWRQSGVPVRGCALSRRAARELEHAAGCGRRASPRCSASVDRSRRAPC